MESVFYILIDGEVFRLRDTILIRFLRNTTYAVNSERNDVFVFFRISQQIVIVVAANEPVRRDLVFFSLIL